MNIHDVGGTVKHWFDDSDYADPSTDLSDGEATRRGGDLAIVRGYGPETQVYWYPVADARSGTPAVPDPTKGCATGADEGLAGPTWSPDGSSLALEDKDGIRAKRQARDCTVQPTLVVPGGTAPDWGPADVNPAPRGGGSKPPVGGGGSTAAGGGGVTVGPLPTRATLRGARTVRLTVSGGGAKAVVTLKR